MGLSQDQKAMLRLLAQREQGYEDLAALMGLSVEEVRAQVKDALEQLEAEGRDAPPAPAEPATPKAEPAPEPQPVTGAPASPPAKDRPSPAAPASPAKRTPPPRPKISLPSSTGARIGIGAAALAIVALIVVLLVSGGGSGDNGGGGETTTAGGANVPTAGEVTSAQLRAVDGGEAEGVATFGRVKNSLALQIEASGLEPTGKGESYTVWLYESPQKMLPLASTTVGDDGKIAAQVEVPTEVLGYLATETFDQIDISLTGDAALKASLTKATKEKKAPIYTGDDVLRGEITGPIIGAANKK